MHAITPSAGFAAGGKVASQTGFKEGGITGRGCVESMTARGAQHPANLATRERSMRALDLALQIADGEARTMLETYCDDGEVIGDAHWLNVITSGADADQKQAIDRAVRYIEVRNPDAFPWRFIRHPDQPHLVRFEDKP